MPKLTPTHRNLLGALLAVILATLATFGIVPGVVEDLDGISDTGGQE